MEFFYLFIVIVLFILAISDLIVGVSNDAVNFLNSAIGSKAAPFRVIMIIASIGILVGATFSSGMMEVARKGIFHPDQFYFSEIMILFLAVMMTDVILLDLFNTFGLPTSTTVSIVFELLGAAVGLAIIKMMRNPEMAGDINTYINSGNALIIIGGIIISVFAAFIMGAIIQFLVRIMFSFDFERTYKYFGALWGGLAITAITYFIAIKGAKGSSFVTAENLDWIKSNTLTILWVSFIGWTILLQLILWLTRANILKFIVLVGTFALAMAFAGNDLVNFIGVPLAGFESFKSFTAEAIANPDTFSMEILKGAVKTPTFYLLIAGAIMAITLWLSRKAKSVTETTNDLSRQEEGYERFEATNLSRSLVRISIGFSNFFKMVLPNRFLKFINSRFDQTEYLKKHSRAAGTYYDLVRASVNLVVASIIISFATSKKLPLSTTYVTFMVAMGTSLSDRAWGRESAVYRISGVLTVILGWFFTAFSAFVAAFLIAFAISYGGIVAIVVLVAIVSYSIYKTHSIHRKRNAAKETKEKEMIDDATLNGENILASCRQSVSSIVISVSKQYYLTIDAFLNEDRKALKKVRKEIKTINSQTKGYKDNLYKTIRLLEEDSIDSGPYYVQVLDYLRETAHCLNFISEPMFEHVDNNHAPFNPDQQKDLMALNEEMSVYFNYVLDLLKKDKFQKIDEIIENQNNIQEYIGKLNKSQLKRIKRGEAGTKNSLLYLNTLTESKNLILNVGNAVKAQRDFISYQDQNSNSRK